MSYELHLTVKILFLLILFCKVSHFHVLIQCLGGHNIFYADHKIKCSTIHLNVFYSAMITCRAPKKLLHYLFECIFSAITLCKASRLVPAQDVHFFFMRFHLSALRSCVLFSPINFLFIFTFK